MSANPNDDAKPGAQPSLDKAADASGEAVGTAPKRPREIGGPKGPEPTRYGDWEINGRCIDF
jgi:hypothetical protein